MRRLQEWLGLADDSDAPDRTVWVVAFLVVLTAVVLSVNVAARGFSSGDREQRAVAAVTVPPSTILVPAATTTTVGHRVDAYRPAAWHGHPCGGDLPPCWVMLRESGGDIHAYNPTGCNGQGCFGKWQCDPRTCIGTGTEAQQDAEARRVWNHGAGCANWSAC